MKKRFFFFFAVACSFWTAIVVFFIAACSSKGGDSPEDGTVRLFLGRLDIPLFDSISINVSAPDMKSIYVNERTINDNLRINAIPLGENRKFEIKIYADLGKLVQRGEATADIKAGEVVTIPITLTALAGFLRLEVPLGIPNNTGIHSGRLFLDDLEFNMKIETGKGTFNTNSLPLDKNFNLRIELYDASGDILFTGSKNVTLSAILQTETIQLQSARGSAILDLRASHQGPSQILAMLPTSISRVPENYGDLFFTEIFANPRNTGGADFQYMEIYNATSDTLLLSPCRIAQTISSATVGQNRLNLDTLGNIALMPMKYLFLGRDSVLNADFNYESFRITSTGQSLGFFCGNAIIDTLRFYASGDNPFPIVMGTPMQLPLANYESRTLGSSWCLGFSPKSDAVCQ
jgi:hypothetical protein